MFDSSVKDAVYGKKLFQRVRGFEEEKRSIETFTSFQTFSMSSLPTIIQDFLDCLS